MHWIFRKVGYLIGYLLFAAGVMKPEQSAAADLKPSVEVAFGYKSAWFAIPSTDTRLVFEALGLTSPKTANWSDGLAFAHSDNAKSKNSPTFVTPPVEGWSFVITGLRYSADSPDHIEALNERLKSLSKTFGEAHYFGSYRVVGYVAWYKAQSGKIVRGFSFADGTLYENTGATTDAELAIGLFDMTDMDEDALWDFVMAAEDEGKPVSFDESDPMRIAERWSVAQPTLGMMSNEAAMGLIGTLP